MINVEKNPAGAKISDQREVLCGSKNEVLTKRYISLDWKTTEIFYCLWLLWAWECFLIHVKWFELIWYSKKFNIKYLGNSVYQNELNELLFIYRIYELKNAKTIIKFLLETYQIDQIVSLTHLSSLVSYIFDGHEIHRDDAHEIVGDGDDYDLQTNQDWRWQQPQRNNLIVLRLLPKNYFEANAISLTLVTNPGKTFSRYLY